LEYLLYVFVPEEVLFLDCGIRLDSQSGWCHPVYLVSRLFETVYPTLYFTRRVFVRPDFPPFAILLRILVAWSGPAGESEV
jgi:hypothetical protein